jgi:hypothetical protein
MDRPFASSRPIGPFAQGLIGDPDSNPEGSMVIAKIDVTDHTDGSAGTVDEDFQQNTIDVVADGVAEGTQARSGTVGATPINFDEAVMFQPFPVTVGQDFQKAILAMMYDENLIGNEASIEKNIDARTDRVQRFDIIPL